ncbi:hypothetical protein [Nocardioides sp.]|uniref:hypothetical protein n=1 Tax=Nocardioides sp. TaxID=35761 RepID=UPI00286BAB8F|nr:hypothetical protein [Nocardioides sp.]
MGSRSTQRRRTTAGDPGTGQLVTLVGVVMILVQLAWRAWALFPSWFFLDDYNLLLDATQRPLDLGYLLDPYNGHLMPGGRLVASLVAESGTLNWAVAATVTLIMQAMASGAALWMLLTLFGRRWGVLLPLGIYLTSVLTVPAFLWWAAALNQVPTQFAIFMAVGAWVLHLRTHRWRWLILTIASLCYGLLFDVKPLLIGPVLAYIALAYFSTGTPLRRVGHVLRTYWVAASVGVLTVSCYTGYYLTHVEQPFAEVTAPLVGRLASSMLGTAFVSAVVGGPWRWSLEAPPTAFADPPAWTVHLAWVMAFSVIVYAALTRVRTARAWVLLGGYLVVLLALLVTSRGPEFGALIGREYRYLTDAVCVLVLCLGLAFLPLKGAPESSAPRTPSLLRISVSPRLVTAALVLICLSGLASSSVYATYWHSDNASDAYLQNLRRDLSASGPTDLVDHPVPDAVLSQLTAPDNTVRTLAMLASPLASFPSSSPRLAMAADDGTLRQVLIRLGVRSRPGPEADCGWRIDEDGLDVPLAGRAFEWQWWIRIGYLSSTDSPVVVSAGDTVLETEVVAGLNTLYARVDGSFDDIRIDGLAPGATMCVDIIEVGQPEPGGTLE